MKRINNKKLKLILILTLIFSILLINSVYASDSDININNSIDSNSINNGDLVSAFTDLNSNEITDSGNIRNLNSNKISGSTLEMKMTSIISNH